MNGIVVPKAAVSSTSYEPEAGTTVCRVHALELSGVGFNQNAEPAGRFTPLLSRDNVVVPFLHVSSKFDGAAYETLFRSRPSRFVHVSRMDLNGFGVSTIFLNRKMSLVPLFTPELLN